MDQGNDRKRSFSRLPNAPASEPDQASEEAASRSGSARFKDVPEARDLCTAAETLLKELKEARETTENYDELEENTRLSAMLGKIQLSRRKMQQLEASLRGRRHENRSRSKKGYNSVDETIVSLQKAVQASERDAAVLEKMLKKATEPQYSVYLYNKLQRLENEVIALSRENKRKDGANNRIGRYLEGEAKGSESVTSRLLREREHIAQEICIQSERNNQLKEAAKQSELTLSKVKERHDVLKEKHQEFLALLEENHLTDDVLRPAPTRRCSKEVQEKESYNASLARKIAGLNLKRHNMHREHERQITELRGHVTALTKEADTLGQKHFRLKIETSRLAHHIQENLNKIPVSYRAADAASFPVHERGLNSYKHAQAKLYTSPSPDSPGPTTQKSTGAPAVISLPHAKDVSRAQRVLHSTAGATQKDTFLRNSQTCQSPRSSDSPAVAKEPLAMSTSRENSLNKVPATQAAGNQSTPLSREVSKGTQNSPSLVDSKCDPEDIPSSQKSGKSITAGTEGSGLAVPDTFPDASGSERQEEDPPVEKLESADATDPRGPPPARGAETTSLVPLVGEDLIRNASEEQREENRGPQVVEGNQELEEKANESGSVVVKNSRVEPQEGGAPCSIYNTSSNPTSGRIIYNLARRTKRDHFKEEISVDGPKYCSEQAPDSIVGSTDSRKEEAHRLRNLMLTHSAESRRRTRRSLERPKRKDRDYVAEWHCQMQGRSIIRTCK